MVSCRWVLPVCGFSLFDRRVARHECVSSQTDLWKGWKNWRKQRSSTKVNEQHTFEKPSALTQISPGLNFCPIARRSVRPRWSSLQCLLAGLMEHTKRLLRAFFELSQTHRGEFAMRRTWRHSPRGVALIRSLMPFSCHGVWCTSYIETIVPNFLKLAQICVINV